MHTFLIFRYSAEFTVYRETLQNANDAMAEAVEIRYKTDEAGQVASLTFTNNGRPFSPQDWSRLRKIAEGNPNEEKV